MRCASRSLLQKSELGLALVPVEHDVADQDGAEVWPAAAEEAVGGMWGVAVDGEVFEWDSV